MYHPAVAAPQAIAGSSDTRPARLRDQLTSGARTILLVLMAASVLVFIIAARGRISQIVPIEVRVDLQDLKEAVQLAIHPDAQATNDAKRER